MHRDHHLGHDRDRAVFQKRVHRLDDAPDRRVFDRHESHVGVAAGDLVENIDDARDKNVLDRGAEFLHARQVRVAAQRSQEGHPLRPFQGKAAGHELPVDGFQTGIGQRAADGSVGLAHAVEDDFLAVGRVDGSPGLVLDSAHLDDDAGPGVEQFDDLVVEFVDLSAEGFERIGGIVGHANLNGKADMDGRIITRTEYEATPARRLAAGALPARRHPGNGYKYLLYMELELMYGKRTNLC